MDLADGFTGSSQGEAAEEYSFSLSAQVELIDFNVLNRGISTLQIKIMYQLQKQKKTTMQNWGQKFVPNIVVPNQRFHNLCTTVELVSSPQYL